MVFDKLIKLLTFCIFFSPTTVCFALSQNTNPATYVQLCAQNRIFNNADYNLAYWGGNAYMYGGPNQDPEYSGEFTSFLISPLLHGDITSNSPISTTDILIYYGSWDPNHIMCDLNVKLNTYTNQLISANLIINKPYQPAPNVPPAACSLKISKQSLYLYAEQID